MGVVGEEEEECEVEEVEYEYAAEDSGILRYNSYDFPGITVARKPWPEIVARIIESWKFIIKKMSRLVKKNHTISSGQHALKMLIASNVMEVK